MILATQRRLVGRLGWAILASIVAMGPAITSTPLQAADAKSEAPAPYPHARVRQSEFGLAGKSYWLFEPAGPKPKTAPVVVLNHGWLAVNPGTYGAWIEHLVRSGHIVIFPRYQADILTLPREFLPNAITAVNDALEVLDTGRGRVRPDRSRFAIIGHSAGANLAAQMAAVASENHLPIPRAVVAMMPGEVQAIREPDLSKIAPKTLLVVAVAENDRVVGDVRGRQIFSEATSIPSARKKFVFYQSDYHGFPRLVAHHLAPTAAHEDFDSGDGLFKDYQMNKGEINAFDRAGFWRLTDMTLRAAFSGKTLDEVTSNGEHFRHLGYWADGRAVKRAIVGNDLSIFPRVFPSNGIRLFDWSSPFPRHIEPEHEPDVPIVAEKQVSVRTR